MRYVDDDICNAKEFFIAHGCNAQGVMGSGVAKALRAKWPQIFEPYRKACQEMIDTESPYRYRFITVPVEGHAIVNLITQQFYGRDGKKYASYTRLAAALEDFIWTYAKQTTVYWTMNTGVRKAYDISNIQIAIPRIGAGLGGLKWEFVVELLLELEETYPNVHFVVYAPLGSDSL